MRLVKIKPTFFRGFCTVDWIDLDENLILLSGPNGFGKTSLSEAIEWLFYGKTKRREKGNKFSQKDHAGSFRNVHAPSGTPTSVETVVKLDGGREILLKRELVIGLRGAESTNLYIDGVIADFSSVGLDIKELFNPIIAQHSLQDFIHSRPKDRRDQIASLLGLDPLVRFKSVVEKARTRFQAAPLPMNVMNARSRYVTILSVMEHAEKVKTIADRWRNGDFSLDADLEELRIAACEFLPADRTTLIPEVQEKLRQKRAEESKRVFDTTAIEPGVNPEGIRSENSAALEAVLTESNNLLTKVEALLQVGSAYPQTKLHFWKTGLELVSDHDPKKCPMCEEQTLNEQKKGDIRQRVQSASAYIEALRIFDQQTIAVSEAFRSLQISNKKFFPRFLSAEQKEQIHQLFQDPDSRHITFLQEHDRFLARSERAVAAFLEFKTTLEGIKAKLLDPSQSSLVPAIIRDIISRVKSLQTASSAGFDVYLVEYQAFMIALSQKITNAEVIKKIDAFLTPLTQWPDIRIETEYQRILSETLDLVRNIEAHVQQKQTQLFASHGTQIKSWYDLLNPTSGVRYDRMEPATDALTLWAQSFGVDLNAIACLSQCQLNCLGLSVNLMSATTSGTPFQFLFFDDPVQSMDDDHCQAFIGVVLAQLISTGVQIIICSHEQGFIEQIRDLYYHLQPTCLRISNFDNVLGPNIESSETLAFTLEKARQHARGNEDNRRLAVKIVRRCTELLIRDVCRATGATPPPVRATASSLIPAFRACTGTTPPQCQSLQATINFANPGPHTQAGWTVPIESNITPHIDSIRQIANTLGVL